MSSVVEWRTAYDFRLRDVALQEGCYDLAALAGTAAKISLSGRVQSQFFHETDPKRI